MDSSPVMSPAVARMGALKEIVGREEKPEVPDEPGVLDLAENVGCPVGSGRQLRFAGEAHFPDVVDEPRREPVELVDVEAAGVVGAGDRVAGAQVL